MTLWIAFVMNQILLLFLIFIHANLSVAQNVLINNDFENYISLPTTWGQFEKCSDWDIIRATPDYFHELSYPTPICCQFGGPYSGQAVVGLGADSGIVTEAIGQNISSNPIVSGAVCNVSVFAKQDTYYYTSCGGIELYGFANPQTQNFSLNYVGQYPDAVLLWSSTIIIDSMWQNYNGTFTSLETFNYLVFTLFENCSQYVYLDSIVINVDGLSIQENQTLELSVTPNPSNSEVKITIPKLEISDEFELYITNVAGQKVNVNYILFDNCISINVACLASGMYQINLLQGTSTYNAKMMVQN